MIKVFKYIDALVINQREDANCKLTFKMRTGTAFDLSSVAVKAYAIVKDAAGTEIVKFAKTATTGWEALDNTLMSSGIFQFKVLSTITTDLKPGHYYVELIARFPSADHSDGYYDIIENEYLFTVESSNASLLTLP